MSRVTRSGGTTGQLPPRVRARVRIKNLLRRVKQRVRRTKSRPLPLWTQSDSSRLGISALAPGRVRIVAETVGGLRAQVSTGGLSAGASYVEVEIGDWRPPWSGWSGRLGPLRGLQRHEVVLPPSGRGPVVVRVTLAEALPLRLVVDAVLGVLIPALPLPYTASADIAAEAGGPPWLPRDLSVIDPAPDLSDEVIRPYDVFITASPSTAPPYGATLTGSPFGVAVAGTPELIAVDAATANPRGRQAYLPDLPIGTLTIAATPGGGTWQISRSGDGTAVVVAGRLGQALDERQSAALLQLGAAVVRRPADPPAPHAEASLMAQLAMTGLVLHAPELDEAVAALLAPELGALLRAPLPGAGADPLAGELRSVTQRRIALRRHSSVFALAASAATSYPSLARPPSVSGVLVTRRPQFVTQVMAAMGAQTYPELEIVLGLHGFEMTATELDRLRDYGLPLRVVPMPGDLSFGEALGVATKQASGSLVTKVDDDDRYGPEHMWDLVLARHYSGATLVGKGAEFVYLEPHDVTVRRRMGSEFYTDVVAGGTMLMSRGDLEDIGGWRPVARSVDRGILDRVLRAGGLVYRTHPIGFGYVRHSAGHTWDPGLEYFLHDPRMKWSGMPPYADFGIAGTDAVGA